MAQIHSFERRTLQLFLLMSDALGIGLAFSIAVFIRFKGLNILETLHEFALTTKFVGVYFIFVFCFYLFDLYEPRSWRTPLFSPIKTAFATGLATLVMLSWFYFFSAQVAGAYGRGVFLGSVFGIFIWALVVRFFIYRSETSRQEQQTWLVLSDHESFARLNHDIEKLNITKSIEHKDFSISKVDLEKELARSWTGVVVGPKAPPELMSSLMSVRLRGQVILSLQSFYEFYCGKIPVHALDDAWFAFTEGFSILHSPLSVRLKRLSDILIATVLLIILSPIMLLTAILIRLESRGAAIYTQERVGQENKPFVMHKFRSMRTDAEATSGAKWADKNDSRVTRVGRIIRKVRLDELPQLWDILLGRMSFVGPRPERPEFTQQLRQKIPFYDYRHLIKPGLTGWAQVMYPYGASEEDALEKLQFELFYIKNYSFDLDIKIVLKTFSVVFFGAGR